MKNIWPDLPNNKTVHGERYLHLKSEKYLPAPKITINMLSLKSTIINLILSNQVEITQNEVHKEAPTVAANMLTLNYANFNVSLFPITVLETEMQDSAN